MFDYYICGDKDDSDCENKKDSEGNGCQCVGRTFDQWNEFYLNCQEDQGLQKNQLINVLIWRGMMPLVKMV